METLLKLLKCLRNGLGAIRQEGLRSKRQLKICLSHRNNNLPELGATDGDRTGMRLLVGKIP